MCEALVETGQLDEIEVCLHGDGVLLVIYCDAANLVAAVNHYNLMVALAAGYPSEGGVIDLVRKTPCGLHVVLEWFSHVVMVWRGWFVRQRCKGMYFIGIMYILCVFFMFF